MPAIDDSALRPVGVAVLGIVRAREQRDFAAALGGIPRCGQAAEAAANDENVGPSCLIHERWPIGISLRLNLKTYIDGRSGMRERAHGNPVHARFGEFPHVMERDSARRFGANLV